MGLQSHGFAHATASNIKSPPYPAILPNVSDIWDTIKKSCFLSGLLLSLARYQTLQTALIARPLEGVGLGES